ncbi:DNA-directed RNA polymerase I subunit RPA34 [Streptomyces subrutilus]|uniref:Uncharacterized protein n=1 Tax=Streptomyces subrutilus TaxID=36818 RepID=A0A1E5NXB9_9ACTN|nr:DNA-directed RNA polymerase I subunit RPA34 [Streptomyces subrutilus]OEJ20893.1 hypothetical protein BGK67_35245 [Streptomyces subrutilus]
MTTNTEQSEAEAPAAAEPPPVRDVTDFLADLDAVLADATDTATPAAAEPVADPEPLPEPEPVHVPAPAPAPAVTRTREKEWWENVYNDDRSDLDTHTGNRLNPPKPVEPPSAPETVPVDDPNEEAEPEDEVDPEGEAEPDTEVEVEEPARKKSKKQRKAEAAEAAAVEETSATRPWHAPPRRDEAVFLNEKGRRVIFAGTAYGLGWGTGLYHLAIQVMDGATQYATPVAAVSLGLGVLGLASRSKFGGIVFVGSLGLITALQMVDPAYIIGGGLAIGLQSLYRCFRRWMGPHAATWPWAAVAWIAHVPAATATVALVLYRTN